MRINRTRVVASSYRENTIAIPHSRLRVILQKGDIVQCNTGGARLSAPYVGYRVTHIDWWGVYAVPTDEMLAGMRKDFRPDSPMCQRRHYKFKWRYIVGISFAEANDTHHYQ